MNTNLLIAATWMLSVSLTMYLIRKRRKDITDHDPDNNEARKLWEDTHTFSDWAVAHNGNKRKLVLLKSS